MLITQQQLSRSTRIRLNIRLIKRDIRQLKIDAMRSTGITRDFLYMALDDACERLNRMQRSANRLGVAY